MDSLKLPSFLRAGDLMRVVILCGGKGTRLREHTESIPKPLVEIGDRPILWHIMRIYAHYGFNDFVLCLGYKGELIKEYFLNRRPKGQSGPENFHERWNVTCADTGEDTNTGGRIKRIADLIQDSPFMVTYGDGVADLDVLKLLNYHRSHGKIGTVTCVRPILQFGILNLDGDQQVLGFQEKPLYDQWVNGGFFVFEREMLALLQDNESLEESFLKKLAQDGQLMAYRHDSFWKCMDTYKDTVSLNELWAGKRAPWKIW